MGCPSEKNKKICAHSTALTIHFSLLSSSSTHLQHTAAAVFSFFVSHQSLKMIAATRVSRSGMAKLANRWVCCALCCAIWWSGGPQPYRRLVLVCALRILMMSKQVEARNFFGGGARHTYIAYASVWCLAFMTFPLLRSSAPRDTH